MDSVNENDSSELMTTEQQGEITVENALIEEIFTRNRTGFVTISYGIMGRNRLVQKQVVNLVIGENTAIWDQFGNPTRFRNLRIGMVVSARFSSNMTRSIPPQAMAFSMVILKEQQSSQIEEGRVLHVDIGREFGYILTGIPNNPNRQMKYVISRDTKIRNRHGNPIPLRAILPGQIVRIEREAFQTMSIPPQTSALWVQIISGR